MNGLIEQWGRKNFSNTGNYIFTEKFKVPFINKDTLGIFVSTGNSPGNDGVASATVREISTTSFVCRSLRISSGDSVNTVFWLAIGI